jgi:hypothetical protein
MCAYRKGNQYGEIAPEDVVLASGRPAVDNMSL